MDARKVFARFAVLLICSLLAVSCPENVKNKKITEETMEKDMQAIRDSKQLSDEETRLLAAYIVRSKLGSIFGGVGLPKDKTVGQMIDEQRNWEEEQKLKEAERTRLAEEAAKEEARLTEQLRKTVEVAIYKKNFSPSDWRSGQYEDYILLGFVFKNLTEKDLRGFTGTVIFNDIFDKEICKTSLSYDEIILAGKSVRWEGQKRYNKFMDEDRKLANTDLKNLKIIWTPEKVLFTDGSKIGRK
ncbi:MAG: hypothetical protein ACE144_05745 [Thermodesulfobacteriota bacterium]